MNNSLLTAAAKNFEDAQKLSGEQRQQRIALGLQQVAGAALDGKRDNTLLDTATRTFYEAQMLTGAAQTQRIALGLFQFARALRN